MADSDQAMPAGDGVTAPPGPNIVGTVLLGLLIFGLGAAAGFLGRLLWPHSR